MSKTKPKIQNDVPVPGVVDPIPSVTDALTGDVGARHQDVDLFAAAPVLKVKRLHPDAQIPKYQTAGAACVDFHAGPLNDGTSKGDILVEPGRSRTIDTNIAVEVPDGYVMLVFSRSGHGFKNNVRMGNCVGVIDSDYRGELRVRLHNDDTRVPFKVSVGDRIAQGMLVPAPQHEVVEVDELSSTERGANGYGSTGK